MHKKLFRKFFFIWPPSNCAILVNSSFTMSHYVELMSTIQDSSKIQLRILYPAVASRKIFEKCALTVSILLQKSPKRERCAGILIWKILSAVEKGG